ncbi:hypothetical protein H5410_046349 [Solanum commersonii]|uniref:Uncharacterized protein n=1 Tax=Solanum commersonii TaxID=4109 RepID=A0A9J5XC09_SOLCO|nr:hypothetical protein H5410_046349 [Solanum commersonii]
MNTTTHFAPVQGPQKIKNTITQFEQLTKMDIYHFELWDVTEENNPKNDKGAYVVKMKPCKDYAIVCASLLKIVD